MPDRTAPVEPAAEELARRRATLGEIMRRRGVTDRGQLIDSFRDDHGQLRETDEFLDACHELAAVEQLEADLGR